MRRRLPQNRKDGWRDPRVHRADDPVGANLARRAEVFRSVAPKLRAKGSRAAIDLFLTEDAVALASMLSPMIQGTSLPMTDRAVDLPPLSEPGVNRAAMLCLPAWITALSVSQSMGHGKRREILTVIRTSSKGEGRALI